jgi:Co/Zn/Cd efflux system component
MLFAEGGIGLWVGSAALLADAADFLEDATMYTLGVVALGWTGRARARAGIVMGCAMGMVGFAALGEAASRLFAGGAPSPAPMAATAAAALAVNGFCAWRLAPHRRGDSSMRSIWLSTRNDALLNALTIAAAIGVAASAKAWPDIMAGLAIAGINLVSAGAVVRQGVAELRGCSLGL